MRYRLQIPADAVVVDVLYRDLLNNAISNDFAISDQRKSTSGYNKAVMDDGVFNNLSGNDIRILQSVTFAADGECLISCGTVITENPWWVSSTHPGNSGPCHSGSLSS
jgi:hypothetical protein